jgi:hypothetical protein
MGGTAVEFTENKDGVVLKLTPPKKDEVDRIVVLTLSKDR